MTITRIINSDNPDIYTGTGTGNEGAAGTADAGIFEGSTEYVDVRDISYDSIIGYKSLKTKLKSLCTRIRHGTLCTPNKKYALTLWGYHGIGKTTLALAMVRTAAA